MSLTDVAVKSARPKERAYKLFDERGLFLLVHPSGGKWWRLKYRYGGKEKLLSLGAYPDTSLQLARQKRDEARKLLAEGRDPSAERQAAALSRADTFAAIAEEWQHSRRASITETTFDKADWILKELLGPSIGAKPIAVLKAADILAALRKIEARGKHETTHRARQLAGQVFRYAVAAGKAERDPTADLRGALAPVVVTHRAAITDPAGIGQLLRALDSYQGQPAVVAALRLAPLLFVRPGELRGACWEEFDLEGKEPAWRIPAERMKMREPHIVPLSTQAAAILKDLAAHTGPDGLLFPSLRTRARPMSNNTIGAALRRMGYAKDEMTAHGFRAMASTCLNERGYSQDVIELQLAHAERDQVRGAYRRNRHASKMAERRKLMQEWADYLDGLKAGGNIVPIKRKA